MRTRTDSPLAVATDTETLCLMIYIEIREWVDRFETES